MQKEQLDFEATLEKAYAAYRTYHTAPTTDATRWLIDSVASAQSAIALASTQDEQTRSLEALGIALQASYWREGSLADLTASIDAFRKSVALFPRNRSSLKTVYGLGTSLLERFRLTRRYFPRDARRDLDEAIHRLDFSVQLIEHNRLDVLQYAGALDDLGTAYCERYKLRARWWDYRRALTLSKKALRTMPPTWTAVMGMYPTIHDDVALCIRRIAETHFAHFTKRRDQRSLRRAVCGFGNSLDRKNDPLTLSAAADAWVAVSRLYGSDESRQNAKELYRRAVQRGFEVAPLVAMRASRAWMNHLLDGILGDPGAPETTNEAVEVAEFGWNAVQRLLPIQIERRFQAELSREIVGFGAEAAFIFAQAHSELRALAVAEVTAATLAGEAGMQLTKELSRLADEGYSDLSQNYRAAASSLFSGGRSVHSGIPDVGAEEVESIHGPSQISAIEAKIRSIPGHEGFAANSDPLEVHNSIASPEDWLYIAASPWGTVGLLIRADGSQQQTVLPALSRNMVQQRHGLASELTRRKVSRQRRDSIAMDLVLWLAKTLWDPLYTELGLGSVPLTVFPGGYFAVLPIQAARLVRQASHSLQKHKVTFFPSAALLSRSLPGRGHVFTNSLVITDDALPGAIEDLRIAQTTFGTDRVTRYSAADANDRDLGTEMGRSSLIHFACHGEANLVDPELSSLMLSSESSLSVGDLWNLELTATKLVILGTCQSGWTGGPHIDELMTFPTLFLRAGAGSVLSTLWNVADEGATCLLQMLYPLLFEGVAPRDALESCQVRLIELGDKRIGPADWAAFMCYG